MSPTSAPSIGVVEHPQLAAALAHLGLTVVGGGPFADAAAQIRTLPYPVPAVVLDVQRPGLRGWVHEQAQRAPLVVLNGAGTVPAEVGTHVQLPATVATVLQALGFGPAVAHLTDVVTVDGVAPPGFGIGADVTESAAYMGPLPSEHSSTLHTPEETRLTMSEFDNTDQAGFAFPGADQLPQPIPTQQHQAYNQSPAVPQFAQQPQAYPQQAYPQQAYSQGAPAAPQQYYQQPAQQQVPAAPAPDQSMFGSFGQDGFPQAPAPQPTPQQQFGQDQFGQQQQQQQQQQFAQQQFPAAPQPQQAPQQPVAPQQQFGQDLFGQQPAAAPVFPAFEPQPTDITDQSAQQGIDQFFQQAQQAPGAAQFPQFQQDPFQATAAPVFEQTPQTPVFEQPAPAFEQTPAAPVFEQAPQAPVFEPTAPAFEQQFPSAPQFGTPDLGQAFPPAPGAPVAPVSEPVPSTVFPSVPSVSESSEDEFHLPGFGSGAAFGAAASTAAGFPEIPDVRDDQLKANVIVSYGGKGGVGKTTCAVLMAQRAAAAGLRVVIVDMNRGQGNIRSYLRLENPNLPTVYNAAVTGKASNALISPKVLKENRDPSLPSLGFAVVMSPPHTLADPRIVTAGVYSKVIRFLQTQADLVILDTQIVEAKDTSGLIDNVMVPLLLHGAWGLGVADMSRPGREDLIKRTQGFINQGVKRDRLLLMVNKAQTFGNHEQQAITQAFSGLSSFLGAAGDDPDLANAMNSGSFNVQDSTLRPILDKALYQATENPAFLDSQSSGSKRRGIFGRRR